MARKKAKGKHLINVRQGKKSFVLLEDTDPGAIGTGTTVQGVKVKSGAFVLNFEGLTHPLGGGDTRRVAVIIGTVTTLKGKSKRKFATDELQITLSAANGDTSPDTVLVDVTEDVDFVDDPLGC